MRDTRHSRVNHRSAVCGRARHVLAFLITFPMMAQGRAQETPAAIQQEPPDQPTSIDSVPIDTLAEIAPSPQAVLMRPARRHALLVVGLPGDEPHRVTFQRTLDVWRQWLTEVAGVEPQDLTVLSALDRSDEVLQPTSQNLIDTVGRMRESIRREDGLWVFLLGHGSQDHRQGYLHLPGPDLNATEWAGLFADAKASEQVFWLTHAGSGSFVKSMSLPGRIVIAATDADGEVNETKFPHLLSEIMQGQLGDSQRGESDNDLESDSPNSVLELFRSVAGKVSQAFESNQLVPTEHAQLDDNGDGLGSELADLSLTTTEQVLAQPTDASQPLIDGVLAARTAIRLRPPDEPETPPSTDQDPLSPVTDPASE